jgi:hypothetical protein
MVWYVYVCVWPLLTRMGLPRPPLFYPQMDQIDNNMVSMYISTCMVSLELESTYGNR